RRTRRTAGSRLVLRLAAAREQADEALQDRGQLVTRHVLQDAKTRARVGAAAAADEDVDAVHDLAVHLHLAALQTDVGGVVVAARGGTPRPAYGDGPRVAVALLELARQLHRARLGVDQRQIAKVRARARHQAAVDPGRVVGQRLQQRLLREVAELGVGDVRQNHVLQGREAQLAAPVALGQAR